MIAVTMGDANGIGPEIVLKAWAGREVDRDFFVVGDAEVLAFCARRIGIDAPIASIRRPGDFDAGALNVLDMGMVGERDVRIGELSASSGRAARRYVEEAVRLVLHGDAEALCTLPINKEAVRLTDPDFTGHTELIAQMCGTATYTMMLVSPRFAVTHVSTHVALQEAIRRVRRARIVDVIVLTHDALGRYLAHPRVAVAGLNPHAGEHGAFGEEDEREVRPAVEEARARGIDAVGPEPPDTVFLRASRGTFDAVVCMYHDQGHIPAKLLGFEESVNVTLGLPIVRTSVDHGTGFDIAYKGLASTRSFAAAYAYARKMLG